MARATLLYVVTATGDLSMSEIASRLDVTISTASGAVEHLVSIRPLSRIDDPANRRQVRVSIAAFGRETLEHLREFSTRQLGGLLDLFGDDDPPLIEHAIRTLTDALSASRQSRDAAGP